MIELNLLTVAKIVHMLEREIYFERAWLVKLERLELNDYCNHKEVLRDTKEMHDTLARLVNVKLNEEVLNDDY